MALLTRPKRSNPRSLDALFPRPKVEPVRRCPRGHRQVTGWKRLQGCRDCALYDEASERIRSHDSRAEREGWAKVLNTGPVLRMTVTSTGREIVHSIPRHLQPRGRRRGRALRRRA